MLKLSVPGHLRVWGLILLLLSLLAFHVAVNARFDHDEFEHIHAGWYVAQGELPYKDFYESHHPLFWYLLAPVIRIVGENTQTILVLRMLMWFVMMATAAMVYLIGREAAASKETGLLAVVLLLGSFMFVNKALEIRPDAPQVLFALVSIYHWTLFLRTRRPAQAFVAGLTASVSFVFLQKSLFLYFAYAVMVTVLLIKRRLAFKELVPFVVAAAIPLVLFVIWLLGAGLWQDYLLTNWMLHLDKEATFEFLKHMKRSLGYNAFLWIAAVAFVVMACIDTKMDGRLRWIAFLATFFFLSVFVMPHQYAQYFLLPMALFSVGAAVALKAGMERIGWASRGKAWTLVILTLFHVVVIEQRVLSDEERARYRRQLDRVAFVLAQTDWYDLVFDGNSDFNVFRRDAHYFWHSIGEKDGLDAYNRLTGGRFVDFDPCVLIRAKRPKVISNYYVDVEDCALDGLYGPTAFNKVWMRK